MLFMVEFHMYSETCPEFTCDHYLGFRLVLVQIVKMSNCKQGRAEEWGGVLDRTGQYKLLSKEREVEKLILELVNIYKESYEF